MSGDPRFPEPRIRDEFRGELRDRLMAEAQTVLVPRATRGTSWAFLRPAFAVGLAAILLVAGAGSAAAGSLPGDPAFVLKRAVEELQLTLTFDDVRRVELLAQLTDRRLGELAQVAEQTEKAPTASEEYAAAVTRFRAAVDALQQAAPQDKKDKAQDVADAARDKHMQVLETLRDRVPEQAKPALDRARDEEERDTPERQKQKERDGDEDRTPRPDRTAEPTRSPRSNETPRASATPRGERTATARPTSRPAGSPRASASPDDDDGGDDD